jgi:CxxC motif-containing protein (DUF1111 family)
MSETFARVRIARIALTVLVVLLLAVPAPLAAQSLGGALVSDPGVRGGHADAGGPLPGLSADELRFFQTTAETFQEVDDVPDGLGPRFNLDSCSGCHAQPAVGGTSPFVNPQVANATKNGGRNTVPAFIRQDGPVREVRFRSDGGVHDLFVITGRSDAPAGCAITQPDFNAAVASGDAVFRIPTPAFGTGLIESIPDRTILANKAANPSAKAQAGISGRENREGNAGTITRFGWKAQNKSLQIFSGEAYNVEQGVTNELFQNEREDDPACATNGLPEDHTHFDETVNEEVPGDAVQFSIFMRFLAAPTPRAHDLVSQLLIDQGKAKFNSIGCSLCHTPQLTTGRSSSAALNNKPVNLYSDLLVHNMGSGLADGISQGLAGPDEFRTAPLWGVGQRIFFLHDGRTDDLFQAIQAHASAGSEANVVIGRFNALLPTDQEAILGFLRSL